MTKLDQLMKRYEDKFDVSPYQEITIAEVPLKVPSERFIEALAAIIEHYEDGKGSATIQQEEFYEMLGNIKKELAA